MRLAGKVTLISGGAHGMGAAEARLFAREGAQVQTVSWINRRGGSMPPPLTPKDYLRGPATTDIAAVRS